MRLVFIGIPGSGKGTQAAMLSQKWGIPRITTGDILREAVEKNSPFGRRVKPILDTGLLVPDDLILQLMGKRLSEPDCASGYILDGYPRTIGQAEGFNAYLKEKALPLDFVLWIDLEDKEVIRRIVGRRQCRACGTVYHLEFQPPKKEGICDACGGKLIQRSDDGEETIKKRIEVYQMQTEPLERYYRDNGLLHRVDGLGTPKKVFQRICDLFKE